MSTPVVMPQMGESIAEGTLVRWLKKLGDRVDRDEPLFEISTDKVDAEIPAPVGGVLLEIRVHEGETVPVDSLVATIGEPGTAIETVVRRTPTDVVDPPVAFRSSVPGAHLEPPVVLVTAAGQPPKRRYSPLVRRLAREYAVDLSQVPGTGLAGRVSKHDVLAFIDRPAPRATTSAPRPAPTHGPGENVRLEPASVIRRKIAEHMVLSRQTSAHVHTVFHVNFSPIDALRLSNKARYEAGGAKLTVMAFLVHVVARALTRHPVVNAAFDGANVVYKQDINIGIAVSLESGLIVPVIKHAQQKTLKGLCLAIADVAERARTKQLKTEDVHGGTFTITNPGALGAQFGLPIINQPQSAILGVGTIEKRPVVVDDALAVQTMSYLTLGFDHRLIDGAVADAFMADIKRGLEQFDPAEV